MHEKVPTILIKIVKIPLKHKLPIPAKQVFGWIGKTRRRRKSRTASASLYRQYAPHID
jgi:hypothetical protein